MSMDMYKEIGSGMPGAVVSLTETCINRKGMLNNSEYNSDFIYQISVFQMHRASRLKQTCHLYLVLHFYMLKIKCINIIFFFFSSFANKCLECFSSIAELPAKRYISA